LDITVGYRLYSQLLCFFTSGEHITVNDPSDIMDFRKAVSRRYHCEINAVSVMKLTLNIKFIT